MGSDKAALRSGGETQLARAVALLEEGLASFPADRELLFGAAAFSRELGDRDRAVDFARRLVALDPTDPQAMALLRDLESQRR